MDMFEMRRNQSEKIFKKSFKKVSSVYTASFLDNAPN